MSPTMMLGKKEVGFTNQDENIPSPPTSANNHQHLQQQQQQPQQHNNEILETSFNSGELAAVIFFSLMRWKIAE